MHATKGSGTVISFPVKHFKRSDNSSAFISNRHPRAPFSDFNLPEIRLYGS